MTTSYSEYPVRIADCQRSRHAVGGYELLVFPLASFINGIAYGSFQPIVLAIIFLMAGLLLLHATGPTGFFERRIFLRTYATGWFMAGIAAIYANAFGDPIQLYLDAGQFFKITSTSETQGLSFLEIQGSYENALPIVIWSEVYDFFSGLGFSRDRYIGVLLNVLIVAITSAIAMRMNHRIYGIHNYRSRVLVWLFSACGLLWLFSAIHVRDSMILVAVTALVGVWVRFINRPASATALIALVGTSVVYVPVFYFLRRELVFVPGALMIAGMVTLLLMNKRGYPRVVLYTISSLAVIVLSYAIHGYLDILQYFLTQNDEVYKNLSLMESGGSSLAVQLIYEQPLLVRLVLGSIYLLIFPVPVWSGFQLESVYHLFKSLNALFFYALLPLLVLSISQLWTRGLRSTPIQLFLTLVSFGFLLVIVLTSLENRHFGAFLVPVFLIALNADISKPRIMRRYKILLLMMLTGVVIIHTGLMYRAL